MKRAGAKFRFETPTAEELRAYLEGHAPVGPSRAGMWLPLAVLGMAMAVLLTVEDGWAAALALGVLGAVMVRNALLRRRLLGLERELVKVHELSLQRRWGAALAGAWRLLPRLRGLPDVFARTASFLAYGLDEQGATEAAIVGYDFLLKRMAAEHPGAMLLMIQRAMAQLTVDRLTDADDALRRLRHVEQWPRSGIAAAYRLAVLWQRVRTQHYGDAAAMEERLVEWLRPLGVEAGYGYGLMALAKWHVEAPAEEARGDVAGGEPLRAGEGASAAEGWWRRATLLLPVEALVRKFADLGPVAEAMEASGGLAGARGGRDG